MYSQFKMMCKMSGIPAPPPELMKAMMAGSVKDAMGDSDDVDPQVKEQMQNVMKDFGGNAEGLDEMMKCVIASKSKFDSTPSTRRSSLTHTGYYAGRRCSPKWIVTTSRRAWMKCSRR